MVWNCSKCGHVGAADTNTKQAGSFLFEHPPYASSWNTEMVSFVSGLDGVIRSTVDMCALGMADANQHLHRKTTTLMTNDPVVADAFRPYRCERDHEQVTLAEGRRTRRAQEFPVSSVR